MSAAATAAMARSTARTIPRSLSDASVLGFAGVAFALDAFVIGPAAAVWTNVPSVVGTAAPRAEARAAFSTARADRGAGVTG